MSALALTVDQSLVNQYLNRVDRFVENVRSFEERLKTLLDRSERIEPEIHVGNTPVQQEIASVEPAQAAPAVVTPDDINIDDLLAGMNFDNGMAM